MTAPHEADNFPHQGLPANYGVCRYDDTRRRMSAITTLPLSARAHSEKWNSNITASGEG